MKFNYKQYNKKILKNIANETITPYLVTNSFSKDKNGYYYKTIDNFAFVIKYNYRSMLRGLHLSFEYGFEFPSMKNVISFNDPKVLFTFDYIMNPEQIYHYSYTYEIYIAHTIPALPQELVDYKYIHPAKNESTDMDDKQWEERAIFINKMDKRYCRYWTEEEAKIVILEDLKKIMDVFNSINNIFEAFEYIETKGTLRNSYSLTISMIYLHYGLYEKGKKCLLKYFSDRDFRAKIHPVIYNYFKEKNIDKDIDLSKYFSGK